jgi:ABC-type phosphate transport system substrate-binding protein
MSRKKSSLMITVVFSLLLSACNSTQQTSPTSGSAMIYTSSSLEKLSLSLGQTFEAYYPQARIDFARLPSRAAVESLFFGSSQEIILDRPLVPAESLAAAENGIPIYQYRIATLPLYFAVHTENPVQAIDSTALRRFLTGKWNSWAEIGGPDLPCHPYLLPPGEGSWEVCMEYFGILDEVVAVICSTTAQLVSKAQDDPCALAVVPVPIQDTNMKKLWWRTGQIEIPPNIKTIAEDPCYPFQLNVTYITNRQKLDVAAGFLTFIMTNTGQKIVADTRYRPATIPVRIIEMY